MPGTTCDLWTTGSPRNPVREHGSGATDRTSSARSRDFDKQPRDPCKAESREIRVEGDLGPLPLRGSRSRAEVEAAGQLAKQRDRKPRQRYRDGAGKRLVLRNKSPARNWQKTEVVFAEGAERAARFRVARLGEATPLWSAHITQENASELNQFPVVLWEGLYPASLQAPPTSRPWNGKIDP